jgi:hypothetical protein
VNRCIKKVSEENIHQSEVIFMKSWLPIAASTFSSIVFSSVILVLFRYAVKEIVWGIYIGITVILTLISLIFFVLYFNDENTFFFLIPAVICGLCGLIIGSILYIFQARIRLVIQLFKEASNVISDLSQVILQPLLTFLSMIVLLVIFLFFCIIISSSGHLHAEKKMFDSKFVVAKYEFGRKERFAFGLNCFVLYWFTNFILGCQHFIIASTVCQWYFVREKTELNKVTKRAFYHLLNFHIGTICIGSLSITIVKIVLGLFRLLNVS